MKFLVGYNGSVEAKAALSLAGDFAKTFNAKVFVMASLEGGPGEKVEDINQAEQNLREAKAALSLAGDFAKTFNAKVFVMSSLEGGLGEKVEDINQAEQNLRDAKEFLDEQAVECETHQMARGFTPGEDLVRFAEENEIDHIYVGIEKKSRTSKLILGSTAQYVILKAPCPVITAK